MNHHSELSDHKEGTENIPWTTRTKINHFTWLQRNEQYYISFTIHAFDNYVCICAGPICNCYTLHALSIEGKFLSSDASFMLSVFKGSDAEG